MNAKQFVPGDEQGARVQRYIQTVMRMVSALPAERQRIEADLRAHLEAAVQSGERVEAVLERMGSPEEVAGAFMSQVELVYAGFWRRLAAFVIDAILIALPLLGAAGIFLLGNGLIPPHPQSFASYAFGGSVILLMLASALAAVSMMLLYFPVLEGRFGQTPGKRLLGLRVLKENGLPIGYREAFLRRLSFYFDIFPIDALFIPFTAKHQRGFDIIARTVVVIL